VPRWDHTPRSGSRGLVLRGSTPELFRAHLDLAVAKAIRLPPGRRLLWVKSWNEWAEGNMLEPETQYGNRYLEALRQAVDADTIDVSSATAGLPPPAPVKNWWRGAGRERLVLSELARRWAERGGPLGRRPSAGTTVPVLLCVDCEPDVSQPGPGAGLESVEATVELLSRWREHAARATGRDVRLVWLVGMHGLVTEELGHPAAILDRVPEILLGVEEAGDALGVVPRAILRDPGSGHWIPERTSPALASEALGGALVSFKEAVGHAPPILRFGDGLLSTPIVTEAELGGVRYDVTIEPGRLGSRRAGGDTVGTDVAGEDWSRVPRSPYFPSHEDYRKPLALGSRPLRMVPMTSGPRWLGGSPLARVRAVRTYGPARWKQRDPLDMASSDWTGPDTFDQVLLRTLAVERRPLLAFCITTDWVSRPDHRQNVERCLGDLLSLTKTYRLAFMTPEEVCDPELIHLLGG
jgi:Glycosyltransferase WbsX